jgi:hypothetical protein
MLAEDERTVCSAERADFLTLVDKMSMDDRVMRALAVCPTDA